jgi:phosphoglycolate phosphatase-like HAD superfamily hydrolase
VSFQAIVFDFDGVLVESVDVKGAAFVALYARETIEIQRKVRAYHDAHGGVSRFEKIRLFEEEYCGRTVDEARIKALADRFSEIVEQRVVDAEPVAGAMEFLRDHDVSLPLYVASATPEDELRRIVDKRGMGGFFKEVLGSPRKKDVLLADIIARHGYDAARVLMVGDAITDFNAAQACGTAFLGRVSAGQVSPFPPGIRVVPDMRLLPDYL